MEIAIQLLISVLGVSAMVVTCHFFKLSRPASIDDLDEAKRLLDQDAVGFKSGASVLSSDKGSALIEQASGESIGLLAAMGDGIVIRYLTPGTVKATRMGDESDLTVQLRDFTFRPVNIKFEDKATARSWADKLNKMQEFQA
jgi:hypothetical protein